MSIISSIYIYVELCGFLFSGSRAPCHVEARDETSAGKTTLPGAKWLLSCISDREQGPSMPLVWWTAGSKNHRPAHRTQATDVEPVGNEQLQILAKG